MSKLAGSIMIVVALKMPAVAFEVSLCLCLPLLLIDQVLIRFLLVLVYIALVIASRR